MNAIDVSAMTSEEERLTILQTLGGGNSFASHLMYACKATPKEYLVKWVEYYNQFINTHHSAYRKCKITMTNAQAKTPEQKQQMKEFRHMLSELRSAFPDVEPHVVTETLMRLALAYNEQKKETA
jgi:hypothetical protein